MKLTFIGNPLKPDDNRGFVEMHGVKFPLNVAVEVEQSAHFERLARNNHFRVEHEAADDADPVTSVAKPAKPGRKKAAKDSAE